MADVTVADLSALYDLTAEKAVIGALIQPQFAGEILEVVEPSDFSSQRYGHVVHVVREMWDRGQRWDDRALLNACVAAGKAVEAIDLVEATMAFTGAWRLHAERVVDLAARRRAVLILGDAQQRVADLTRPLGASIDETLTNLDTIDLGVPRLPAGVSTIADVANRDVQAVPWVIPGLLRRGWRVMVVAGEGSGKSVLFRQLCALAAAGMHPLNFEEIPPVCTLVIDLENPPDVVTAGYRRIVRKLDRMRPDRDKNLAWIHEQPAGIDLRTRRHRDELDALFSHAKPDLVCIGPLYKLYSMGSGEREEIVVGEVMRTLDKLRTRHDFALVIEHHAGHSMKEGKREQRPFGTSLWLRWPELGIGMYSDEHRSKSLLHLERWRGDRVTSDWPARIERGKEDNWPWVGEWDTGGRPQYEHRGPFDDEEDKDDF